MPIFAPVLRPPPSEVGLAVDVGSVVDDGVCFCDCVGVGSPTVAGSARPSLLSQHVVLELPQHHVLSTHCMTAELWVKYPPR